MPKTVRTCVKSVAGLLLLTLLYAQAIAASADQTRNNPNLIVNPGFEQGLQGWWVHPRNNRQSGVVKAGQHSGQAALRVQVSNDNRFPDGSFDHYWDPLFCIEQTLNGLKPKTWYEMSLWAKSANAISFLFGAVGPDWYSDYLPLNCPAWQRFVVRFHTDDQETSKKIFLRTFDLADEVLIDDVAVVEAAEPQAFVYAGMIPEMTKTQLARLVALKSRAKAAKVDNNAYVKMGLYIAARYLDRVQRPDIEKKTNGLLDLGATPRSGLGSRRDRALIRQPLPDVPPIPFDHPKIDRGVFVAGVPPVPHLLRRLYGNPQ